MESTKPEFWEWRYREGKMPWDFQGVPKALQEFLQTRDAPGKVLIPGCGSAYEIKCFHDHGWEVLGIDFCKAAVERAKQNSGVLSDQVLFGNFFDHDFGHAKFNLIYERTFLCSMPPDRWPFYQKRVAELLNGKGLLAGFFLYGENSDPPPYPITQKQAEELFASQFKLIEEKPVTDSLPIFSGKKERWQIWKRA